MAKPSLTGGFDQTFQEQVDFFRQKLNLPTEAWDDIWQEAHDRAFVVAGAMKADLLDDLRQAVDKAISQGTSLEAFRKDFAAIVGKHGWQGWTGEGTPGGFAWRTRVIYETNLRSSYAAGRWQQLNDPGLAKLMPYWRYVHNESVLHPRPLHQAWGASRLTLPRDHPFWKTHFPPNGWGCRCRVTAVPAPRKGDATEPPDSWDVPDDTGKLPGIDKGWAYAPGANVKGELSDLVKTKAKSLPTPLATALQADVAPSLNRSPELAAAVSRTGREIASDTLETAVILDRSGNELLRKQGESDAVQFSTDELAMLPGTALVHNHPGSLPQSFSVEDIALAVHHRLAEIHAVDRLYHYSATDPAGAWSPAYWRDTVSPILERVTHSVTERMQAALTAGLIAEDQYHGVIAHLIWTEVSQEVSLGYQRIERKP